MHGASLPVGDREESPEKFVIKWGGLVVTIHAEEGNICLHIVFKEREDFYMLISPEDVRRVVTQTPFFLPEVFKEVNEALRVCASIARDQ